MAPKRKPTDDGNDEKRSKKPKADKDDDDTAAEEKTTADLQRKNKDLYDVVDGDESPAVLNVKDDTKLTLKLKHKKTGNIDTQSFRTAASDFDWSDKDQVQDLQKWRRQRLRRYGFPLERTVTRWMPLEVSFLELLLELLQQRLQTDKKVRRPTAGEVTTHFNDYFKGKVISDEKAMKLPPREERQEESIASKLKHAPLGESWKAIKETCSTGKNLPTYLPTITEQALQEFVAKKKAPSGVSKNAPTGKSSPKGKLTVDHLNKEGERPSLPEHGSDIIAGIDQSQPPSPSSKAQPAERPVSDYVVPPETATITTPLDEIEKMIKDEWLIPGMNDGTEVAKKADLGAKTLKDPWMKQAVEDLDDRWKRRNFGFLNSDKNELRPDWYGDKDKELAERESKTKTKQTTDRHGSKPGTRKPGAQNVNALLSLALCPPIGYGGDVKMLEGSTELSTFDLALARENKRALVTHSENFSAKAPRKLENKNR